MNIYHLSHKSTNEELVLASDQTLERALIHQGKLPEEWKHQDTVVKVSLNVTPLWNPPRVSEPETMFV